MKTTRVTSVLCGAALLWPLWLLSAGCDEGSFVVSGGTSAGGTAGSGGDSSSGTGGSGGATAVLTAADDSYTVTANGYLVEGVPGVLANDLTPISSVTVTLLSGAQNGNLKLATDGSFEYAPRPFFVGTDSFEYTVADGTATSSATATITVEPDVGDGSDGDLVVSDGETKPDVNRCYVLESAGSASVTLSSPDVAMGNRLLLLQVQEGSATLGDQTPFGPSNVFSNAGVSQIVTVMSVGSDGAIGVAPPPIYSFNTVAGSSTAQACVVPQYNNVTVAPNGMIRTERWDGSVGGVVAFFVAGTATIDGLVGAASAGFRGGQLRDNLLFVPDVTDLETDGNAGGGKGEGPDASSFDRSGRGNLFSAAGGGNGHNAGGGGGGHYGAGGFGGKQWEGAGDVLDTRGLGGAPFIFPADERLMLGGGGGAGHQDNVSGGGGGRGGGIIFIWGNAINGSGSLIAAGQAGTASSIDGAGGGGAGGTIFVRALTSTFAGSAIAHGGNGGDITGLGAVGPGGGGGGGRLLLVGIQPNTIIVAGGTSGHFNNDSWGATDGASGSSTLIP